MHGISIKPIGETECFREKGFVSLYKEFLMHTLYVLSKNSLCLQEALISEPRLTVVLARPARNPHLGCLLVPLKASCC